MIDAVGTSSVQGASQRYIPQGGNPYVAAAANAAERTDVPRLGTRLYVKIDSAAERAILEVRSSDTGEVVNQYPSEAQIRAFQRAAKLSAVRSEQAAQAAVAEVQTRRDTQTTSSVQTDTQQAAPVRDAVQRAPVNIQPVSTPTPVSIAAPAPQTTSPDVSSSTGGSAQGTSQSLLV